MPAEAFPEVALAADLTAWPSTSLPVFIAMMFGATLAGNGTAHGGARSTPIDASLSCWRCLAQGSLSR
jgi:hypothetical protein